MKFDETELIDSKRYSESFSETPTFILPIQNKKNSRIIDDFETETEALMYGDLRTTEVKTPSNKKSSIDDIYFEPDFSPGEFQTVLRLLADANKYSQHAIDEYRQGDLFASDDAILHLQSLLPELFCCRSLSEGFGAIINAIQNALLNNKGLPLPETKLLALQRIIQEVRNKPFMSYDKVVDVIIDFEAAGFIVEPEGFDYLTEILDE